MAVSTQSETPDAVKHKPSVEQDVLVASEKPSPQDENLSENAQAGVRGVEATTMVWSKSHLIAAYTLIWLIYFVSSLAEVVFRVMNPIVTSVFVLHSLSAAVNIVSSIVAGLTKLALAKILDTWGRPQGLALSMLIWMIGIVMTAACASVPMYAAANVFTLVGAQAVSYCVTIFVSDTSSLRNRALMLAFATSPYIITPWIGGPMGDRLLGGAGWRWAFGIFAILVPAVVAPLSGLFLWNHNKAKKAGLIPQTGARFSGKTVWNYILEVDLLGLVLLAGGMALFLLPFSLWSYQSEQWRSPMIISMIIIGAFLICVMIAYEHYLAPVKFIPVHLLADRTVFFGGLMFTFVFFNAAVWGSYFFSMLLVVWDQSYTNATYISNIYRVGSCFSAVILGWAIRHTGRFKWVALYFALPIYLLGVGLMIHFRQPDQSIGYVIMTQIFVAVAGGPIVLAGELAMMTPVDHQHIAVIIAILDLFGSVGTAVGSTVSAAIWTGTFRNALVQHLPANAPIDTIYGSLFAQLGYPAGTAIRQGISLAYGDAQRYMLITSTCILALAFGCVALWRDIDIKKKKQVRGHVV